jgi:hypothetical protein
VTDGGSTFRTPLADLPPGVELAVRLAEIDVADASDAVLVDMLVAQERQKRCCEGRELDIIRELAVRCSPDPGVGDVVVDEFSPMRCRVR